MERTVGIYIRKWIGSLGIMSSVELFKDIVNLQSSKTQLQRVSEKPGENLQSQRPTEAEHRKYGSFFLKIEI